MKTRQNFVSNSSSTSFIIGWNPSQFQQCPHCGLTPSSPIEIIESNVNKCAADDTEFMFRTKEEGIELCYEDIKYGGWSGDEAKQRLQIIEELTRDFEEVCGAHLSYHDESEKQLRELQQVGLCKMIDW